MTINSQLKNDDPWNFRTDAQFPRLIFLSTVLRWALAGYGIYKSQVHAQKINKTNDEALSSLGAFLAEEIENGSIPIFNVHTMIPLLGDARNKIVARCKSLNWSGNAPSLTDEDGLLYYVDGEKLYTVFSDLNRNIAVKDKKSLFMSNLENAVPQDWRDKYAKKNGAIQSELPPTSGTLSSPDSQPKLCPVDFTHANPVLKKTSKNRSRIEPLAGDSITGLIWKICSDFASDGRIIKPKIVMSELKRCAGLKDKIYPLICTTAGGVKFEYESGDEGELNSELLRKRIDQWKEKNV